MILASQAQCLAGNAEASPWCFKGQSINYGLAVGASHGLISSLDGGGGSNSSLNPSPRNGQGILCVLPGQETTYCIRPLPLGCLVFTTLHCLQYSLIALTTKHVPSFVQFISSFLYSLEQFCAGMFLL